MMRITAFPLSMILMIPMAAQVPDDQAPIIKVDVDVVNILCSVRDKHGAYIPNLTKDDFTIFEDGKPQTVRYFNREKDLALTIGLLVDVSRSQENLIGVERQAAAQFFASVLGKKDMAFLISFGAEAELLQDYTNSHRLLRDALDQLRVNAPATGLQPGPVPTIYKPRGTVLFDAVYLATTDRLKGEVGRKAVVLITDGVDQGSRLTLQNAMSAAQKADTVIYSIYYVDPSEYGGRGSWGYTPSDSDLRKMSEETGGRLFRASRKTPLEDIFRQLQEELRNQYAIGYTPANPEKDGKFRKIEIRMHDKEWKVQARKGYFAVKP
ncbi:MAG: VWA domain-containing protein [Bryobacteraceae bacterium]